MDQIGKDATNAEPIPPHHFTSPPPYPGPPVNDPTVHHLQVVPETVTVNQPGVVLVAQQMGPDPTIIVCNTCNEQCFTRIDYMPTTRTHLTAAILFLLGLWPCVFIPYCMNSCLKVNHYCTRCGAYIGSYNY